MTIEARDKTAFPVSTLTVSYYLLKITMHIAQCGVNNDFFTDWVRRLICSKINNFSFRFPPDFCFRGTTEVWWIHTATYCLRIATGSLLSLSLLCWFYWKSLQDAGFITALQLHVIIKLVKRRTLLLIGQESLSPWREAQIPQKFLPSKDGTLGILNGSLLGDTTQIHG